MNLSWPAATQAGATTVKIYRAVDKHGPFTELVDTVSSALTSTTVDSTVTDNRFFYQVAYCTDSEELARSQAISYETINATTEVSDIVRRVRRLLGDIEGSVYKSDIDVHEAISDALDGFVAGHIGTDYTLEYGPNALLIGFSPEMTGPQKHLLAIGAAMLCLEGEYVSSARDAVSTESAAGRVNLTAPPEHIRRAIEIFAARYSRALQRATGFELPQWGDTSRVAQTRGFIDMTSDYKS